MSEELTVTDINDICRLCLKGDGTIIPIFGRENTSRDCIPLSKKILDCVSVKVLDGDGLPNMICVGCVHQVDSWHGFKTTCDSSQKKLKIWLQKRSLDNLGKDEVGSSQLNENKTCQAFSDCSAVIDLSSDDEDDLVITHQPTLRSYLGCSAQRVCNIPSSHSQNIGVIPLEGSNEMEILPVDDVICSNEKENSNQSDPENIPSPITALVLPDIVTGLSDSMNTDLINIETSPNNHILPDSDLIETVEDLVVSCSHDLNSTVLKKKKPKDPIIKNIPISCQLANNETLKNNVSKSNDVDIQIMGTQFSVDLGIDCLKFKESDSFVKNIESTQTGGSYVDQDKPNCFQLSGGTKTNWIEGIEPISNKCINNEISVERRNLISDDNSYINTTERVDISKLSSTSAKPNEELAENSIDNSASLVIGDVTSLTNDDCERIDEEPNNKEKDHEVEDREAATNGSWHTQGDSSDLQPDIVICDTSMVISIKEEPMSAGDTTGDEEDPLNFQSVTIKREPEDWTKRTNNESEVEDVKPNVRMLNEEIEIQYTPKKLKSGKIHCEPCRVSFLNDVYYDRHTKSLRHKMNIKLFHSGRAPTRKRGKSLIQAIMGNNFDLPRGKGPFFCNQCPSGFKHLRNLKTHQKKHLIQAQTYIQEQPTQYVPQRSSDYEVSSQNQIKTSKPIRLSAQNLKFADYYETKCDLCNQCFTTFPALISHKRFCGAKNRICKKCHQTFTTLSLFFKHKKECGKFYGREMPTLIQPTQENILQVSALSPVPLDGSVLACTLCNFTFQSSPQLIEHMQQNHMDFGKPQLPIELPNFTKPNNFSRSNDSKLHYCKYCIRSFSSHSALSSHTGYHARKNVYCCKFCKQCYRDKLTFRQHMKVHIGNPNLNRNVCWICYTPFSSQKDLADHKNVHSKIKMKIYPCAICGNSYNTRELLSKHKKTAHHNIGQPMTMFSDNHLKPLSEVVQRTESKIELIDEDNKLFKCRICKKKFTTLGNLKRHGLIHKRPLPNMGNQSVINVECSNQNRCSVCFRTFKTQSGLLNHRLVCSRIKKATIPSTNVIHLGNSLNKPLKCKGCKKWFASQNSLYKHRVLKRCRAQQININHLHSQNCPNCDQQFLSEESLNRHKQHCKPSIERLTCDCGEVFSSVDQRLTHADSCLSNCTCKTCNLKFNSPEELESHQLVCQIEPQQTTIQQTTFTPENRLPPVECNKCNKKFVYSKCLKIHQDKCLFDRWPCSNCKEIFPTEAALTNHKKSCQSPRLSRSPSTTSLNESPSFKCEFCPVRFISADELKQHTYACENRPTVKRRDVNSAYRSWNCDLCDKTFLWKANLQRHKKLAHRAVLSSSAPSTKSESPVRPNQERETGLFRCEICPDTVFHKKQGFLEHQLSHERQEGILVDGGNSSGNVNNAMLTCELCDKKLPESLYPLHMDEHMNDDFEESRELSKDNMESPKFVCDICGKEFDSFNSRKCHRATHYRGGDILSHLSPKKFQKKKKIKGKHIRCTTCNKLLSVNSMPKHKMMHVREAAEFFGENQSASPSKSTPVSNTPMSGNHNFSELILNQEENDEAKTSIFPCSKCDKSFKLRKLLLEHLKGHQDDSFETESTSSTTGTVDQFPYKCVYCDLSWKHKSVYERHIGSKKHLEIQKQLSGII